MRLTVSRLLISVVSAMSLALALTPSSAGAAPSVFAVVPLAPSHTAYGYSSVDPAGNLWMSDYYTNTVTRISPSGTRTNFTVPSAWALTTDANGNAFAVDYWANRLYEITASGTVTIVATGLQWANVYGLVVDPAGGFWVAHPGEIDQVSSGGTSTLFSAVGGYGLVADANGNLYTNDISSPGTIYSISPSGAATPLATSSLLYETYDVAVAPDGTVYGVDLNGDVVAVSPGGAVSIVVPATAFPIGSTGGGGSVAMGPGGVLYVGQWSDQSVYTLVPGSSLHLSLSRTATSLSASWSGGIGPFVCTLMYGYNSPSSFTIRTTSTTCTFNNVASDTPFGVRVSSDAGSGSSVTAMAAPVATTITCTRDGRVRHVSGLDPRCPAGWRRR
jgi:hypothetical protein